MRTTSEQDTRFLRQVLSSTLLEDAIEWIQLNLSPDDVFDEEQLGKWARENGYVKEEGD